MSDEMIDRILAFIRAAMARTAARKRAGEWRDEDEGYHHLHALITSCLTGASSDERAERLMRLADDLEERRSASAFARLLTGEIDLVAVFAEPGLTVLPKRGD